MTIRRVGERNPKSGDRDASPVEFDIDGVLYAPNQSDETDTAGRDSTVQGGVIYCPDSAVDVLPTDEVVMDSARYQVVGPVRRWTDQGAEFYIELKEA